MESTTSASNGNFFATSPFMQGISSFFSHAGQRPPDGETKAVVSTTNGVWRPPPICKFYVMNSCKFGSMCQFSHVDAVDADDYDLSEHWSLSRGPAASAMAMPCKYFAMGTCKRGDACSFAHLSDARSSWPYASTEEGGTEDDDDDDTGAATSAATTDLASLLESDVDQVLKGDRSTGRNESPLPLQSRRFQYGPPPVSSPPPRPSSPQHVPGSALRSSAAVHVPERTVDKEAFAAQILKLGLLTPEQYRWEEDIAAMSPKISPEDAEHRAIRVLKWEGTRWITETWDLGELETEVGQAKGGPAKKE
eukprot:TRINITY_DN21273_c0_g1_i1.p1 TRINITY_DN21273_c0_g1~~TRINITY_DN21273_c0_g1_i1.p1  ORF type:complete len:307 (-),score=36.74 TRINITY_DN21273_c0_g1_i1:123-1043(-)